MKQTEAVKENPETNPFQPKRKPIINLGTLILGFFNLVNFLPFVLKLSSLIYLTSSMKTHSEED